MTFYLWAAVSKDANSLKSTHWWREAESRTMDHSVLPLLFTVWNKLQDNVFSAAFSGYRCDMPKLIKLNDMVYEVYTPPDERPELEIVFFHGLQSQKVNDAYVRTWICRDNSHLWIQTWLVELFPKARILTVSYESSAKQQQEFGMMYCTAENLLASLTADEVKVGQAGSPVAFVGHCLGGLVLKELCLSAARMMGRKSKRMPGMERTRNLLSNIGGMFFYGTPHGGSLFGDKLHNYFKGALLEEMETLKVSCARSNQGFADLRSAYGWITSGMGESRQTYVESLGTDIHLVSEAASRHNMDYYYSAIADHYDICKPERMLSSSFQQLGHFLRKILEDRVQVIVTAESEYVIDFRRRAKKVSRMLARTDVHKIFIVGLSGIGKTTLARQVYNAIRHKFDATCFVSLDSIEGQSNGSEQVWKKIQEAFEGMHIGSTQNLHDLLYELKSRKVLMVLDNVESQGQLDVLHSGAWLEGSTSQERCSSKLIVTSTTSRLGSRSRTFEVGYLSWDESKELFCHYAFQGEEGPHDLGDLIDQVIDKCENFPFYVRTVARFVSESNVQAKELWLDILQRLEKAEELDGRSDYRLWAKLRKCYDCLLPFEQEILLDIATIFHGFPLSMVLEHIWKVCRENPHKAWLNLKSRFLVSVNDGGIIQMHALLRNLGQRIACPRSATVQKWKRISGQCPTKDLISNDQGIMETLSLELKIKEIDLITRFDNFDHLQYLLLEGGTASSVTDWGKLPRSLIYLRWKDGSFAVCPIDFTGLDKLVVLEFLDCKSMKSLPPNIVEASNLTWLELEGCSSLSKLPLGLSRYLQHVGLERTGLKPVPIVGTFKEGSRSPVRDSLEDLCNDPITMDIMCDPVKCSDGSTYCRWTILDNARGMSRSPYDRKMKLVISCDDITIRRLLFSFFPEQESKFRARRKQHREQALQHARADPDELEDAIEKLNNVLKWDPGDKECKTELGKVLDLVEQRSSRASLLLDLLNTIPEVRHEDVIEARIDNEGGRLLSFLVFFYIGIWLFII